MNNISLHQQRSEPDIEMVRCQVILQVTLLPVYTQKSIFQYEKIHFKRMPKVLPVITSAYCAHPHPMFIDSLIHTVLHMKMPRAKTVNSKMTYWFYVIFQDANQFSKDHRHVYSYPTFYSKNIQYDKQPASRSENSAALKP